MIWGETQRKLRFVLLYVKSIHGVSIEFLCANCQWQFRLRSLLKCHLSRDIGTNQNIFSTFRLCDSQFAAMTIYNLYIFDKYGILLHYAEWHRVKQSGITCEEEAKLMYGMIFSIKSFVNKISPSDPKEGFLFYKTNKYALHYLETATGLKWVWANGFRSGFSFKLMINLLIRLLV